MGARVPTDDVRGLEGGRPSLELPLLRERGGDPLTVTPTIQAKNLATWRMTPSQ
ncbi:hypothetical protein [Archangium sp.]|uniref:hypothetical protein n=1 Tax=Archangium sp. TaxID=1872627 RepID=UPI002D776220|nr:hypothetical protein [Archangium sp.]